MARVQSSSDWRGFRVCGSEDEGAVVTAGERVGGLCVGRLSARMPASLLL